MFSCLGFGIMRIFGGFFCFWFAKWDCACFDFGLALHYGLIVPVDCLL